MTSLRDQFALKAPASKTMVWRYGLSLGIAVALLVAGIAVTIPAKAQSRGAEAQPHADAMPPATSDARPLQIDRGAVGLWQNLLRLRSRASLLMVVAHPDDE